MSNFANAEHVKVVLTHACNLDCTYCFFLSKEALYPGDRFRMPDDVLAARLAEPATEIHFLERSGAPVGLCELRWSGTDVEVAMFGVVGEDTGNGAARAFMAAMLERAWRPPTGRVWLHTCSFDHPAAVHFYRRMGFLPFKFAIEVSRDPRLDGHLPETAGAHVALIRPQGG